MGRVGRPQPHILIAEVEEGLGLYDPVREEVAILNPTAADIWVLCDGERPVEEIVARLADAYQLEASHIRDDVTGTIQALVEGGFLSGAA